MDSKIDPENVAKYYNELPSVWPECDSWYLYTRREIAKFIQQNPFEKTDYILNAGAGDLDYDIHGKVHHVDIAEEKIKDRPLHTVANIENLPFANNSFNGIVCVGSVLNYCDAIAAISELSRVLCNGGKMILEFESSCSYEFLGKSTFAKDAELALFTYQGQPHQNWIFSPTYIKTILNQNGLQVRNKRYIHILSSLALHFGKTEEEASKFAKYDKIVRWFPVLNSHGSNIILVCIKH